MSDNFKDIWDLKKPGAIDSERHKQRIRDAIRKNLHELISEENIISSGGNRKVKIPIKYLDMWRFRFGKDYNQKGVGHGEGKPGDQIVKEIDGSDQGEGGGSEGGEEIYEEEVDVSEVIEIMLEDLNLPYLEQKEKSVEIETEDIVFQDVAERGLPPNIDKRKTVIRNMRKNALNGKLRIGGFEPDDIRYRVWEQVVEKHSKASVILIMDRSGSMSYEKKYVVKAFFWWMARFIELKYDKVELVFIAHDIKAKEVEEKDFFLISESGGTKISSAFILANEIINSRFPPSVWNNYIFAFSDGDNWLDDNDKCIQYIKDAVPLCQAVGYGEVHVSDAFFSKSPYIESRLSSLLKKDAELHNNKRFIISIIDKREDIYQTLKDFLTLD